jgi:Arc/MetJ family transcription regulator
MASNIEFDPYLLSEVVRVGGFRYKKDAVNAALKEYLQRHQQIKILDLFGSIEYDEQYNYKKERKR